MKRFLPVGIAAVIIGASIAFGMMREYPNPDPNHTHADFAVWVNGTQLDFSSDEFMSKEYVEGQALERDVNAMRKFLHLHDGNGQVVHRHKPGLTLGDFVGSLGVIDTMDNNNLCLKFPQIAKACGDETAHRTWMMKLSSRTYTADAYDYSFDYDHVFEDGEKILIIFPSSGDWNEQMKEVDTAWAKMTDDACKYSKTCPWRGEPPTENCIADPTVPCVAQ